MNYRGPSIFEDLFSGVILDKISLGDSGGNKSSSSVTKNESKVSQKS